MPDIDSLSVNITSSSKPAVNAINEIINSLGTLNRALNDPKQVTGAENITKSLNLISRSVNSIDADKIKNLSNVLSILSATGTKLSKQNVAQGLSQVGTATQKASEQAKSAKYNFNNFATALNNVNYKSLNLRYSFTSLAAVAGTLYANFFLLIRAAKLLGKAMDYSSSMTEAQNVVTVVFGENSKIMDDFAETAIKDFGLARLAATEFASRFQAMGKTMGITSEQIVSANDFITKKLSGNSRAYQDLGNSVAHMSINLTKLTADIASLYNQDYEDVAKDMQSIFTGMTRPLRKYGLDLTNATLKEWAMSQGLDSNIEKMSQAEKTMLRYQYVMSRAGIAMGDFQKTQDTFANSLRTVKQLLQEIARIIGEALINALGPALIQFKHFLFNLVDMTQSALNAIGKLLGWKQIDFGGAALVEDTEDYADALDDAAGAAKKLKTQLRGIDELNNLTSNKGGGGGGANASDFGANLESIWDLMEETNRAYESSITSWNQFGKEIAKKIKEGLSSIDWDQIYSKAGAFGVLSASFLNGLIDPEAFNLFGKTLGGGVMTAIKAAFSFGKNFDWKNLGDAIAGGINGFFEEFNGGELADTVDLWVQGLETTFKEAAKKINWNEIFVDLFDFFDHLDIKTIGVLVTAGTVITGLPAVAKLLGEQLALNPLTLGVITIAAIGGFKIGEEIGNQFEKALGTNPETGESRWYEWWETEFDFYFKAWEKAKKLWQGENNPYMLVSKSIALISFGGIGGFGGKSIAQYFYNLFTEKHGYSLKDVWKNLWDPQEIADTILNSDAYKISDAIAEVFTIGLGDWGDASPGKKALDWLLEQLSKLEEHIPNIEAAVGVLTTTPEMLDFMDNMSVLLGQIVAFGDPANVTGINNVGDAFGLLGIDIDDLKEKFNDFTKNAKEKWEEITKFFNEEISKWIEEDVKPFFDKDTWLGYLSGIKEAFEQIWKDPLQSAKDFFGTMGTDAENFINGLIDGFKEVATAKGSVTGSIINFTANHIKIKKFADGGYPQMGSLFWANEAGPELVGTMNGKTAVASNNEITGITAAINSASASENELLRQQNQLLQGILAKEFGISSKEVFTSVRKSAREYVNMTGNPAF